MPSRSVTRATITFIGALTIVGSSAILTGCRTADPVGSRLAGASGSAIPDTLTSDQIASYRRVLDAIAISDQKFRTPVSWGTEDPDELARLEALDDDASIAEWGRRRAEGISLPEETERAYMAKQSEIDRENCGELMELVDRWGWPSEARLGAGTPDMTAVLIHMPMDMVGGFLPRLERETLAGRMNPKRYAVIYDRKRQHDGEPQLYGTAQAFDAATRTVLPPAVVDIDATNAARDRIGLEPLDEYRLLEESPGAAD